MEDFKRDRISTADDAQNNSILHCEWVLQTGKCECKFQLSQELFFHLTEFHIGRKARGNLSLTCMWNNCGHTSEKRDHIVSHSRVHVPTYKPHTCKECDKSFSRAQDLKKHIKIHMKNLDGLNSSHQAPLFLKPSLLIPMMSPTEDLYIHSAPSSPIVINGHFFPIDTSLYSPAVSSYGPMSAGWYPSNSRKRNRDIPSQQIVTKSTTQVSSVLHEIEEEEDGMNPQDSIAEFFGSIKRKRLISTYNSEMAAKLDAIAEVVMKSQKENQAVEPESIMKEDFQEVISANVQNESDVDQLNFFLSQLYNNLQADKPALSPLNEKVDWEAVVAVGSMNEMEHKSKSSNLARPTISVTPMHFDQDEFKMFYPLSESKKVERLDSVISGLNEEEFDKYFTTAMVSGNERDVHFSNKDLRIELLRKGMENVSLQTKAAADAQAHNKIDTKVTGIKRTKNGRYPSFSPVVDGSVDKKPAEPMLSDPAAIVRMVNKSFVKATPSSLHRMTRKDSKSGEKLNEEVIGAASLIRRYSHGAENPSQYLSRNRVSRSQSQPHNSSVHAIAMKGSKEYHSLLISLMMKQLEKLWDELKKTH